MWGMDGYWTLVRPAPGWSLIRAWAVEGHWSLIWGDLAVADSSPATDRMVLTSGTQTDCARGDATGGRCRRPRREFVLRSRNQFVRAVHQLWETVSATEKVAGAARAWAHMPRRALPKRITATPAATTTCIALKKITYRNERHNEHVH